MTTAVAWSTGKDSMMALRELGDPSPVLLTSLNDEANRTSMHGLREELLERQVEALGLDLRTVRLPPDCPNETYEIRMNEALGELAAAGITEVVFGDLFLEDIRAYREEQMEDVEVEPRFPIWERDTEELARRFLEEGCRAIVVCVDADALDGSFAGREYDEQFLTDLPTEVDPCGENGEFHTYVYDGPDFDEAVPFERGCLEIRDGFAYRDLQPT
jgi:uncharacterized protein (TIGR00290 family)